jgi:MYXO-CTERM domain-containing protein
MPKSVSTKTALALATLGVAAFAAPARAADPQLVAFDETYVQELNGNVLGETFHHGIKPAPTEPASWVSPINYSKGTAYLYMEVLEKPSKRNTLLTVCFDGPKEGYGCFDTKTYTDVGAYETKVTMGGGSWYQYNKVAWNQRRDDYHLVIKDPALNGTQGGKPATDYVPTKLRVVLTIVPPGGTYTPPAKGAMGDGGVADAGAAPDAGAGFDASDFEDGGFIPVLPDAAASGTGGQGGPGAGGSGGTGTSGSGGSSGVGGSGGTSGGVAGNGAGGSSDEPPAPGGNSGRRASSSGCSVGDLGGAGLTPLLLLAAILLARRRRRA